MSYHDMDSNDTRETTALIKCLTAEDAEELVGLGPETLKVVFGRVYNLGFDLARIHWGEVAFALACEPTPTYTFPTYQELLAYQKLASQPTDAGSSSPTLECRKGTRNGLQGL
jgi:hypothetical protein